MTVTARIPSVLLAAVLVGASLAAQSPAPPQAPRDGQMLAPPAPAGTASFSGTVVIRVNGQPAPVRRARMTLQSGTAGAQTTDTDTQGRFRFDRLATGTYQIAIDKPGFVPVARIPSFDLKDGQAVTMTAVMQRASAITGRVVTEDGEPAMGLTVSAVRLGYGPYGKKPIAVKQTTTDDLGRFRVHTLPPGEYLLEATVDPLRMLQAAPGKTPKPTQAYYPGTPRLNDAQSIVLGVEQEATDMNFTVASAVLSAVSGRITMSSGKQPAPGRYTMRLQRVGFAPGEVRCFLGAGNSEAAGFQCRNVPPGEFWLLVVAQDAPGAVPELSATRVTVSGQDIADLDVTTAPGAAVTGQVAAADGSPLPAGARVAVLETDYEFPSINPGVAPTPPVAVGADGAFSFPGLGGPRLLRMAGLPDDWALAQVSLDDADVSDLPMAFSGDRPHRLRLTVTHQTGAVHGTVIAAAGQPAAGERVVIFPEIERAWIARSRQIKTVETDAAGHYAVRGLLPGRYFAAFVDSLEDGAWEDPDVLARLRTAATPLAAVAGQDVMLDWRIK